MQAAAFSGMKTLAYAGALATLLPLNPALFLKPTPLKIRIIIRRQLHFLG